MSVEWTLTYNAQEQSFADWGLANVRRTLISQAPDKVSFVADGRGFDAAELFAYGSTITIQRNGVQWFLGRVTGINRHGDPNAESVTYELSGPWWYLDNLVFQQRWKVSDGGSGTTLDYKSRLVLGQAEAGDRIDIGEVIAEVISYASGQCSAPITCGTISVNISPPWDEAVDITCAEVIKRCLRWCPDAVAWFDYSTTPDPTLHIKPRSALTSVSKDLTAGSPNELIDITPRPDLVVPGVFIKYEQTHTVNNNEYEKITLDSAGTGSQTDPGAIVATIELSGMRKTYVFQPIVTEDIPTSLSTPSAEALAWWRSKCPELVYYDDLQIEAIARTGTNPRELTEGQIQDWMSVDAVQETIRAKITYSVNDGTEDTETGLEKVITVTIMTTDATTRTYWTLSEYESAEPIPSNVAAALYDALKTTQYQGSFAMVEEELTGSIGMGNVLNFTNGQAAWASMNALIQSITEYIDSGRTEVSFGPPAHLAPREILALLRPNRSRRPAYSAARRISGDASSGRTSVRLGGEAPKTNSTSGGGSKSKLVIKNDTKKITLDPSLLTDASATEITARELEICVDGAAKTVLVLMSEPY